MSIPFRVSAIPAVLTIALTACGGAGGGGSVIAPDQAPQRAQTPPVEAAFTSFSAIGPNQTAVMSGLSQTGSGTDANFTLDPADDAASTATLTYDTQGNVAGFSMSAPRSGVAFDDRDFMVCSAAVCSATDGASSLATVVNLGWNYQAFGVWLNDLGGTTFQAGAMSAGAPTPASAVPTVSSATFTGHAGGFYFDGAGGRFTTDAEMRAVTDFSTRNIQFSTNLTTLTDMNAPQDGVTPRPALAIPELNLTGTLSYGPGVNRISGDVKTQNLELTGKADGRFYGPSAQEIGGTYGLGAADGRKMLGGFGGKRP